MRACPRCGDAFEIKPRGRPQKWCTPACRRAAHAERVAAEYACLAVEVVETRDLLEHDLDECVARVAASPTACKRLLRAITDVARARDLTSDPSGSRWSEHHGNSRTRSGNDTSTGAEVRDYALEIDRSRRAGQVSPRASPGLQFAGPDVGGLVRRC